MFLPRALSATTDAQNALVRLKDIFYAELMTNDAFVIDRGQALALRVHNATFEWEQCVSVEGKEKDGRGRNDATDKSPADGNDSEPFQVKQVSMDVLRGSLVAVVGSVGRYASRYILCVLITTR